MDELNAEIVRTLIRGILACSLELKIANDRFERGDDAPDLILNQRLDNYLNALDRLFALTDTLRALGTSVDFPNPDEVDPYPPHKKDPLRPSS
jgi:hypothetical protein